MKFVFNDGGRADTRKGFASDCVCRSIAIATGKPYEEIYKILAQGNTTQIQGKHKTGSDGKETASFGISVKRKWFKDFMHSLGFVWVPTMAIGQGCTTHLRKDEIPPQGIFVVAVSKHYTCVIDGNIHDTHDPSRNGSRCVYGYWKMVSG